MEVLRFNCGLTGFRYQAGPCRWPNPPPPLAGG
jgi:hypothetical protein